MEWLAIAMLNGVSYGLLLFMLSAGFTLIFSMMGVLNFAHASFYMLGAYGGYWLAQHLGFWPALVLAPCLVGMLGAAFERYCLRHVHKLGHVHELLVTFGLSYVVLELVQLVWGRVALDFRPPDILQGPVFTWAVDAANEWTLIWGAPPAGLCVSGAVGATGTCTPFPATRGLMAVTALSMLGALALWLTRTRMGLIIRAAMTHPEAVEALGHNVPRIFMLVFGVGSGLAALAGVIGGSTFVTEPAMASTVGPVIFVVVVVGGLGSLAGAFWASLLIGVLQTMAVSLDVALIHSPSFKLTLTQVAPLIPYLLMVAVLIVRPQGLLGQRAP